jgi:hypothetical protein
MALEVSMSENRGISGSSGSGAAGGSGGGGLVSDATSAVRNVANSASDMAGDAYEQGSRYVQNASDYLPDVGEYAGAVRGPIVQNPLTTALVIGAIGYLAAYLIHGGGFRSLQGTASYDDGQSSKRSRRRHRRE